MQTLFGIYTIPDSEDAPGTISYVEKMFIAQFVYMTRPSLVIETGCYKGHTTKYVSLLMSSNNIQGKIVSFDLPEVIETLLKTDSFYLNAKNIELIKGPLPESLDKYLSKTGTKVDFAIIDSEHSYNQVISELETVEPYMNKNSYILCHDYLPEDSKYLGVVEAVKEFSNTHNYSLLPLRGHGIWGSAILTKI